jgi:hypothetical protein
MKTVAAKVAILGLLAGLLAVPTPALAWRPHSYHGHGYYRGHGYGQGSNDVALAVLGGIVGGIVLGQMLAPPPPRYYPPPPPVDPYNSGYQSGYESGLQRGRYERYEAGRQRGYEDGVSAGRSGPSYPD